MSGLRTLESNAGPLHPAGMYLFVLLRFRCRAFTLKPPPRLYFHFTMRPMRSTKRLRRVKTKGRYKILIAGCDVKRLGRRKTRADTSRGRLSTANYNKGSGGVSMAIYRGNKSSIYVCQVMPLASHAILSVLVLVKLRWGGNP